MAALAAGASALAPSAKTTTGLPLRGDAADPWLRRPRPDAPVLSPLVFGTLRLHETERPKRLLTLAWDLGMTAFDCAAVYGGGECERILGDWLRDASTPPDARRRAVVITKGGCGPPASGWAPRLRAADVAAELDASIVRRPRGERDARRRYGRLRRPRRRRDATAAV